VIELRPDGGYGFSAKRKREAATEPTAKKPNRKAAPLTAIQKTQAAKLHQKGALIERIACVIEAPYNKIWNLLVGKEAQDKRNTELAEANVENRKDWKKLSTAEKNAKLRQMRILFAQGKSEWDIVNELSVPNSPLKHECYIKPSSIRRKAEAAGEIESQPALTEDQTLDVKNRLLKGDEISQISAATKIPDWQIYDERKKIRSATRPTKEKKIPPTKPRKIKKSSDYLESEKQNAEDLLSKGTSARDVADATGIGIDTVWALKRKMIAAGTIDSDRKACKAITQAVIQEVTNLLGLGRRNAEILAATNISVSSLAHLKQYLAAEIVLTECTYLPDHLP
jgi:hypothetical protein